ncbi:endolytic transglycosylase MltG [Pediococcus pentosaceus]|uniref:Endolytic murein transglycosylase n=2 Tax=Pediococcus pentosaceus TaxID=1255 RepID=A0ABD7X7D2_PEDPE|nr:MULTISPECIES: endolytic transglycosylase MltG [Pediococcus]MCG7196633.1 endolytic transglycosylase MltG [Pediococcus pentosaceus]MCH4015362.1 endolytic transglycosylase MltG [Pediococcus pentosaceus]MCH4098867.1 endolytic transglycosylase MltG [Pediococcus pentosaceus]MCI1284733.1 endolytic transglycosylase MltG [Pediococcus pentosaceus]MCI1347980.1 endolytic transglycosylase MltG [Pediococcus pentosaceus]
MILDNNNDSNQRHSRVQSNYKRQKNGHNIIKWVIGILVAVVLITTFMGYRYYSTSLQPLDAKSNKQIEINIPVGTTSRGVGSILEDKHVVKSGAVFNYYTKSKKINNFQAGYYVLKPSMTLKQIAKKLEKGGAAEPIALNGPRVLIKEGENIDQIANSMKSSKYFKKSDFLKLMKDEDFIKSLAKQYPKLLGSAMKAQNVRYRLEGYLFPASYAIDKNTKLKDVITQMVAKEDAVLQPYYSKIKSDGLTVQETLSVASLVEMEGSKSSDRSKIAGVFLNRIKQGETLGSDVSTRYAVKKSATEDLTQSDLASTNPYNTRVNTGFMPGPVDNPGEDSILSVVNADTKDGYLFFFAVTKNVSGSKHKVGDVLFYKDITSFNEAVAKYNPEGK